MEIIVITIGEVEGKIRGKNSISISKCIEYISILQSHFDQQFKFFIYIHTFFFFFGSLNS